MATAEQAEVGVLAWPEVTAGLATEVNAVVAKTREPEVVWPAWAKTRECDGQMQMWYLGRWAPMEPAVTFRPWFEEGGLRVLAAASVGAVAVEVWRMERGVSWRELERPAWQGFVHRETAIAGAVVWREGGVVVEHAVATRGTEMADVMGRVAAAVRSGARGTRVGSALTELRAA